MLEGDKCLDVLVQDLVFADDESGANRNLGFLFLYEVLRGRVGLTLLGVHVGQTLGVLLTQYLHLKVCGRVRVCV